MTAPHDSTTNASSSAPPPLVAQVRWPTTTGGRGPGQRRPKRSTAAAATAEYAFDHCAGPATTQRDFFNLLEMERLSRAAMDGATVTLLCFGQTGSGKTYTLSGATTTVGEGEADEPVSHPLDPVPNSTAPVTEGGAGRQKKRRANEAAAGAAVDGLAQRQVAEDGLQYQAVRYVAELMARIQNEKVEAKASALAGETRDSSSGTISAKCTYTELYCEQLWDLLQPLDAAVPLKCRWSAEAQSFYVEGSMLVECRSLEDFLLVLREGQSNRQRGSHRLNADSSRSHVIFSIYFDRVDGSRRRGRLVFVDLAGSERLKESQSNRGDTGAINKSLFMLGSVLEQLSSPEQHSALSSSTASPGAPITSTKFISYRSSILTQILMGSLSGCGYTIMVACVSPSARHLEESMRTIHYAQRARHITATATVNTDAASPEFSSLKRAVQQLTVENEMLRGCLGLPLKGALTKDAVAAHLAAYCERYEKERQRQSVEKQQHRQRMRSQPRPWDTAPAGSSDASQALKPNSAPHGPKDSGGATSLPLLPKAKQRISSTSTVSLVSTDGSGGIGFFATPSNVNVQSLLESLPDTQQLHR